MNNRDDFKLDVISGIEDEIIDRSTKERIRLLDRPKLSFRKRMIALGSMAAMIIAMLSGVLFFALTGMKQIPVYTGMSVSETNPMFGNGSSTLPTQDSSATVLNGNENNGNHYGHYKGDHAKDVDDIDINNPFGKGEGAMDDAISSIITASPESDMYYAKPGDDIFITIHIDNPDKFEILSFTLNGEKYTSYMFEYGSDIENLILKLNVGNAEGIVDYTIDEIKYVDGTEIKDVKMEGDKTVRVGISTDKQPTVIVTDLKSTLDSISFSASVQDTMDLISSSNGKVQAVLFDGDKIVSTKDLKVGTQSVVFDGLKQNTIYQYAILITYDDLSGEGVINTAFEENVMYTSNPLLFDDISIGKDSIRFTYKWYSELKEKSIVSVKLLKDGVKIRDIDKETLYVKGLLSSTSYTIITEYKMGSGTETIRLDFTTKAKTVPTVNVYDRDVGKTDTSIYFDITEIDEDNIASITKIELLHGSDAPIVAESLYVREFNGLLSNNTYTVRVTYVYDLNDGNGEQTAYSSYDITTDAKAEPKVKFTNHANDGEVFSFGLLITDQDSTFEIRSIELYLGKSKLGDTTLADKMSFELSDNTKEHTVVVTYLYDPNDGTGKRVLEAKCSTWVPSVGFEMSDGRIVGMGTCTDTVLFISDPVAENAFKDNLNIERVYLLTGATTIDDNAFSGCLRLKSVYIGEGVETMSPYAAFNGCVSLTDVYVSSTVKILGSFQGCSNLKSVVFAENSQLTNIGCFRECASLKTITIPDSVTYIDYSTFFDSGIEHVLFGENSKLTTVKANAFYGCTYLKSIKMPKTVTAIEDYAFAYCRSLKSILLHSTVASVGNGAFDGCDVLTIYVDAKDIPSGWNENMNPNKRPVILDAKEISYTIVPNNGNAAGTVTEIFIPSPPDAVRNGYFLVGWYDNPELSGSPVEFPYYSNEKTTLYAKWFDIGENTVSEGFEMTEGQISGMGSCTDKVLYINQPIRYDAFKNNTDIEKVYLLSGANYVGSTAFEGCTNLKYVYIGEGLKAIEYGLFRNCTSLEEIYIPSNVEMIDSNAFFGCSSLKSITIPNSITKISDYAFSNSGIERVDFGDDCKITIIGKYSFQACNNLKSFKVPDSVLTIKEGAFYASSELETIIIPKSVISIEANAFNTAIFEPKTTIFVEASEWSSLWSADANPYGIPVIYNATEKQYSFEANGGSTVDPITDYFVSVSPVTERDGYIFKGWYDNPELTGEPVEFLYFSMDKTTLYAKWSNEYVFNSNGGSLVESVDTPTVENEPIPTRSGYLFSGWYDNAELNGYPVSFPYSSEVRTDLYAKWYDLQGNPISQGFETKNGVITGIGSCTDTVLYIDRPVGEGAFMNNPDIERVYLLYGADHIAPNAFNGCLRLQYVYIGEGVEALSFGVFEQCPSLTDVYVSSTVKEVGSFSHSQNLKRVEFAENSRLTDIGSYSHCKSLTEIKIPDSVKTIGYAAFGNSGIESVTFGKDSKLETIEVAAFMGCGWLKSIILPDSVTKIGNHAFNGTEMRAIYVPSTLSSFGEGVFTLGNKMKVYTDASVLPEGWSSEIFTTNTEFILGAKMNTYSFVTNDTSSVDPTTVLLLERPPVISRPGHFILGWYDNPEFNGDAVTFPYYSEEKTTLYATWINYAALEQSAGLKTEEGYVTGIGSCVNESLIYVDSPIGASAFLLSENLTTVILGDNVSSIGDRAFESCYNLKSIIFVGDVDFELGSELFTNTWSNEGFTVYVPKEYYSSYKSISNHSWRFHVVSRCCLVAY